MIPSLNPPTRPPEGVSFDSRDLFAQARALEHQGHWESAALVYGLIGEQNLEARDRLNAISGEGGLSSERFEFLASQFAGQVTDPAALFAMAGAQGTYRLVSAGLGKILGFAAEAGLFPIYHRLGDAALGRATDWSSDALRNDTVGSFAVLGGLRLFGGLSRHAFQLGGGSRSWLPLYEQAGQYGGIVLGHGAESRLLSLIDPQFQAPNHGMGQTLVESLVTLIHFNGMGRILGHWGIANPLRRMDSWLFQSRPLTFAPETLGLGIGPRNSGTSALESSNKVFSHGGGSPGRNSPEAVRLRYGNYWDRMAEKLADHQGSVTPAIKDLGIPIGTFYYRLNLALEHALPEMAIYPWAQRLSGNRKAEELSERFRQVAGALEIHRGNISRAAKHLGVTPPTIYRALRRALRDAPGSAEIRKWTPLLSPQGRVERKRRQGLDYMLALVGSGGDIKAASRQLDITQGTFARFLERILSEDGDGEYGRFYRRVMIETLCRVRPGDNRVLRSLEEHPDPSIRYFITQSIFSENRRVRSILERVAEGDSSPLVRQGARQSLDLSKKDRVLMSFGKRSQTRASILELMRRTGIERKVLRTQIRELRRAGHIIQEKDDVIKLGPSGRLRIRQMIRQRIWDNLDSALGLSYGHQRNAALLLGTNYSYLNTVLKASMGKINDGSPQRAYYQDSDWLAPPDHPIMRWGDSSFVATLRRAKFREERVKSYQPVWDRIKQGLLETKNDYDRVAESLGMTNRRFRTFLRLAIDYKYQPLLPFANADLLAEYDAAKRSQARQELHHKTREHNKEYLTNQSPYRGIATWDLPFERPYRDLPQALQHEYVLRFQWGDELAGKRMERVYHQWLTYWSRRNKVDGLAMEDLYQAGIRGMLEAARRFDIHRGAKFTAYAWYYVFNYQIRQVRRALGATLSSEDYRVYREMVNLSREAKGRGEEIDFNSIARRLQVSIDKLEEIRQAGRARFSTSWEGTTNGGEGRGIQEVVSDQRADVAQDYLRSEMRNVLAGFMASYVKRNGRAIPLDVLTAGEERLQEIAGELGMELYEILTAKENLRQELQDYLRERDIDADFFE